MKKIIFILAITFSYFAKANTFIPANYWYNSGTTFQPGDQGYIAVKYQPVGNYATIDTLHVELSNKSGSSGIIELFKMAYRDLDGLPKQSDGTTWLYFTIPSDFVPDSARIYTPDPNHDRYGILVNPKYAPTIITSLYDTVTVGEYMYYDIVANNYPSGFTSSNMPTWMSSTVVLNENTIEVNGTPSDTGTFHITIVAYNNTGNDTQTFTLVVKPATVTEILLPTDQQKRGIVSYYDNLGNLIKEAATGSMPGLQGGFIYRILYEDKTIRSGHVYFN